MKTLMENKPLIQRYKRGAQSAVERKFNIYKMSEATYDVYEKTVSKNKKGK